MKIAVLFLLCAAVGAAQTAKQPNCIGHDAKGNCTALEQALVVSEDSYIARVCDREGDKGCGDVLGVTKDAHGCNSWGGYLWNEKSETCQIDGSLPTTSGELLECHATPQDAEGKQRIVCSYKPKERVGAK